MLRRKTNTSGCKWKAGWPAIAPNVACTRAQTIPNTGVDCGFLALPDDPAVFLGKANAIARLDAEHFAQLGIWSAHDRNTLPEVFGAPTLRAPSEPLSLDRRPRIVVDRCLWISCPFPLNFLPQYESSRVGHEF